MKRLLLATCVALMVGGCATEVEKAPSSLPIPDSWRQQVGPHALPEAQWWQNFGDADLNRLVTQALQHNSDILTARSRVDQYRAELRAAQGDNFPTLSAGVAATHQRALSAATGQPYENAVFQGLLQANYEVDLWGSRSNSIRAAQASLDAQRAAASAAELTVASSVASGYLSLCALDEQLRVTEATLATRENSLNLAQRQFETGYTSRLEWMQAASEYQTAKAQIPQLQHQIEQQENALSVLVGMNPREIARSSQFDHIKPQILPSLLPSQLLNRRPDIVQAQRQLLAADASLASSQAKLLPSLNLTASGTLQSGELHQLLDNPFRLWSIGGSILAPLLNREALTAQVDVAMATRNQALYGYEKVVRNAFSDVDNALDAIRRSQEQLEELQKQEGYVAEAYRIAHNRYQNGYASYLDELDAQRTLFSTQLNIVSVKNTLLLAQIDLYRSLGGGWQG
ncbi:efflux transporter, outer membrane factor (OMF) lipoprotein, NodT family [Candidatus Pantoea symbiotica]|uniref:Efflux transporter, outer membrane factor (OMF) lipoprotein, NodT family n=1 Tax=Candidatus Pantoea symbiotica TaxID=1884370 RepID=A0A1I3RAZ6_9GAMM|nr:MULTISPECIES: efflux transporter outer membrane subunit [Pantoea]KAJ9433542.1 efflux transporter outer membrane subunit [Pantoea sp. YR343]MRT22804.1 efflux transporter outer membrane subunit [Enterobacteriaceae bacterium RIT697]SFJ42972.1 efflux transporter, outer membrane factor (OMF) lipoprotein, NodT family [Pantoea symbiotica]SFU37429.1 efflux transporter, outer membrane factor (OMF) lipoprotein, NodT family [Pantoea sp. YR525]